MSDSLNPNKSSALLPELGAYVYSILTIFIIKTLEPHQESVEVSYNDLVRLTGFSRRKVIYSVKKLIDKGYVKKAKNSERNITGKNTYILGNIDQKLTLQVPKEMTEEGGAL